MREPEMRTTLPYDRRTDAKQSREHTIGSCRRPLPAQPQAASRVSNVTLRSVVARRHPESAAVHLAIEVDYQLDHARS